MSVSSYGISLIGASVPISKLILQDDVRGCEHWQSSFGNFCATCGKPTWLTRREFIPQFSLDDDESDATLGGLPVFFPIFLEDGCKVAIVTVSECFVQSCGDHGEENYKRTKIPLDLTQIKDQIKSVLSPLKLWNENSFGLWSICQRR